MASTPRRAARRLLAVMPGIGALAAALLAAAPARATFCTIPSDCTSGFCVNAVCCATRCDGVCEACSAAAKGGGADGTCGQASTGSVCAEPRCDGASFSWVGAAKCNASGACVPPEGVKCDAMNDCKFDLCADTGCETVVKLDGTVCGAGMACQDGDCVTAPSTTSSSSTSGGPAGSGVSSSSSTGGGAASSSGSGASSSVSAGGAQGAGAGSATGAGGESYYPPIHEGSGCGCRTAGDGPGGGALLLGAAALALARRRRG